MRVSLPTLKHSILALALLGTAAFASQQPAAHAASALQHATNNSCAVKVIEEAPVVDHLTVVARVYLMKNECNGHFFGRLTAETPPLVLNPARACVRVVSPVTTWTCSADTALGGFTGVRHVDSPEVAYVAHTKYQAYGKAILFDAAASTDIHTTH
jgi:hypothetical protein